MSADNEECQIDHTDGIKGSIISQRNEVCQISIDGFEVKRVASLGQLDS
jgi:hypothetical protein